VAAAQQLGPVGGAVRRPRLYGPDPGWPDDPDTVAEATAHPEVFTGKSVGQVADHFATIVGGLDQQPVVIGHSFGGC
jgi:non-heme chloroperoxidase